MAINTNTNQETDNTPAKKALRGTVTSAKAKNTVTVQVSRYVKHPKYKKYRLISKKYLAHDPEGAAKEGDTVTIRECRPVSKRKHFEVVEVKTV
ncbi:MAG: 30S ribosomal protein S17 [Candidatus Paceibacteria bacterium]